MNEMKEKTEQSMQKKQSCAQCGETSDKLYQHNLCKECLKQSFQRLIPMINEFRIRN
jgi:protein-arginine kinase activator protein McsA